MIPWRSCMTIVTRETSVETFIEITMFRTASFQICDRHPIIIMIIITVNTIIIIIIIYCYY